MMSGLSPFKEALMYSRFFWHEFRSDAPEKTKEFLMKLFPAWTHEVGAGPFGPYHMFSQEGRAWIGLMQRQSDQSPMAHVHAYVSVDDIEATAGAVTAAGGEILAPPFEIPTQGRALVAQDPSGGVLSLMQSDHPVLEDPRPRGPGQIMWNELATRNAAAALAFYQAVCGWTSTRATMDQEYYFFSDAGQQNHSGVLPMVGETWGDLPSHWMPYFEVANADAAQAQVHDLGGKVVVQPFDIPKVGRILVVAEPGGCAFSLIQGADEA